MEGKKSPVQILYMHTTHAHTVFVLVCPTLFPRLRGFLKAVGRHISNSRDISTIVLPDMLTHT